MKEIRLVIGNKNYSGWSLSPWLLLKMFNMEFEEIRIALYQSNTAEKLGPYSPSLKVPVLLHKEVTVWDSLAICEYISEVLLGGGGGAAAGERHGGEGHEQEGVPRVDPIPAHGSVLIASSTLAWRGSLASASCWRSARSVRASSVRPASR